VVGAQPSHKSFAAAALRELRSRECRSDFIDFQKYLRFAKACLDAGFYPGSPEIERAFMRTKDCLILSELHPDEIGALQRNMRLNAVNAENLPAVHIHHRDGFEALRALTPPKTKRGIVFCDPSYEDASDWERTAASFIETHKRWAGATLALWYPLVAVKKIERDAMKQKIIAGIKSGKTERGILDALLCVNTENSHRESALKDVNHSEPPRLYGSGMLVVMLVGAIFAVNSVLGLFDLPFTEPDVPAASTVPSTAAHDTQQTPSETTEPTAEPITITSAKAVDQGGSQGDHPENEGKTVDGNPATTWESQFYRGPKFANLKSGTGIAVTLDKTSEVSGIDIQGTGQGGNVQVRATSPEDPTGGTVLAEGAFTSGTTSFTFSPTKTQSIVIWVTDQPTAPDGESKVTVSEITFK